MTKPTSADRSAAPLTKPFGAYPHVQCAGPFVFLAGQGCRDPISDAYAGVERDAQGSVQSYDIEAQTAGVLRNMERALASADLALTDLVDVTVFLKTMDDFAGMNAVWNSTFAASSGPTRTTVAVHDLPGDNYVEMKGIALRRNSPAQ